MMDPSTSDISITEKIHSKTTEHSENLTLDGQQQEDNDDDNDIVEEKERVPVGTQVLINNTKEQKVGQIIGNEITYHYSVDFGDDTYSHDMYVDVHSESKINVTDSLFFSRGSFRNKIKRITSIKLSLTSL